MTIYLNFRGEWPLTLERKADTFMVRRGVNQYWHYARWLCFEFLWRNVK